MKILTLNSGSSSIKYKLFDMHSSELLASGLLECIGEDSGNISHEIAKEDGQLQKVSHQSQIPDHKSGVVLISTWLKESGAIRSDGDLSAVGHRVVHGGAEFKETTLITPEVLETIRLQTPLAPLHNPANLLGIEVTMSLWPEVPQVAVFDTAFHSTIPNYASQYALPKPLVDEHRIRRYGFHGTSHKYVTDQAAEILDKAINEVNLIVLHLGNGASVTAVKHGKSIDTSMGMTPLEGLVMGTRSGDLDAGIVLDLIQSAGLPASEVYALLNKSSGLKGICGDNDMRKILARAKDNDTLAKLAIEIYCYRIKKYIGAYSAIVPELDAIVFTAGVGEHSAEIRLQCCQGLEHLGIRIDADKNNDRDKTSAFINAETSPVKVLVIPTNEELEMAKQTKFCLESS